MHQEHIYIEKLTTSSNSIVEPPFELNPDGPGIGVTVDERPSLECTIRRQVFQE